MNVGHRRAEMILVGLESGGRQVTATDTRLLEGIDPALWVAYNAQPDEWVILHLAIDQALESGREGVAEFLKWVVAKKRWPSPKDSQGGWGWWVGSSEIPIEVDDHWVRRSGKEGPSNSLWRCWKWWESMTPQRREECWKWEPKP